MVGSDDAQRLRIVTWNLQGSKLRDVGAVAQRLAALEADVVFLQEVQRRQYRRLKPAVGKFGHWTFKHWPVKAPSEGLALLARVPVVRHRPFTISRGEAWTSWRRRVVQAFVVEIDGATLRLANTHLGAGVTDEERARQARRIVTLIRDLDVVGGDLNVLPDSGVLAEFRGLTDAWARAHPGLRSPNTNWEPGPRDHPPVQRLDYVLVTPRCRVLDVQIPTDWERWAALSDHLPVVVDIERPAPVHLGAQVVDLRE